MRAQGLGLVVAVAVASVGVSAEAAIIPYTFQKVAETGANYTSLGAPSVVAATSATIRAEGRERSYQTNPPARTAPRIR